jgi:hypothetical protein
MAEFGLKMHRWLPGLPVAALLCACASAPVEMELDGAVPVAQTRSDPLLAGRLGLGGEDLPLRFSARYLVEPGDVFAESPGAPGRAPPSQLARQRMGQDTVLRLPEFAGAPPTLKLSSEVVERWSVDGQRSGHRERQAGGLGWSRGLTKVKFEWADGAVAAEPGVALLCDLKGALQAPLNPYGADGSATIRMFGRSCRLQTSDDRYSEVQAQAWGMAVAWEQTELVFSAIEPDWGGTPENQPIDPAYELRLRQRFKRGPWIAGTQIAMRQASAWDLAADDAAAGQFVADKDAYWTASASMAHQWPATSLSANWSHGTDPMWFMPQIGQRSNRFDLRLDLSEAFTSPASGARPKVGVHWYWTEAITRANAVSSDSAMRIDMAWMF